MLICESWSTIIWGKLQKSLRDARQKSVKRETQHWSCHVPTLLVWMDSASTSSELISKTGSNADSDIQYVDLVSDAVTAPAHVTEVSVQGSVEVPPAIDAGQVVTMDNVIPAPLYATYVTSAHAPPVASTSNQVLLTSTSAAAPLLIPGPSFPPRTQGPISMLPGTPTAFSGAQRASVAPPAPYRAPWCRQCHTAPFRAKERHRAPRSKACPVSPGLMLVHLSPLQLGQCICLVTCLGPCILSVLRMALAKR